MATMMSLFTTSDSSDFIISFTLIGEYDNADEQEEIRTEELYQFEYFTPLHALHSSY